MSDGAEIFDAVIAGAGIGGSCAAIALAKRGARVLLIEAGDFPRHKVCGEFLSPESRALFARLQVLDEILNAGAGEISSAQFVGRSGSTVRVNLPKPALGISRWKLDEILWSAAEKAGVLCIAQTRIREITRAGELFAVHANHAIYRARAAVDATGRARLSTPKNPGAPTRARFIGLKAHFRSVRLDADLVELHFLRGGYCGISRVEDELYNVCLLARYDERVAANNAPARVWQRVLAACPELQKRMNDAARATDWIATANVQFIAREPVTENGVLRVGDAGGYIHPLAGDGMTMAVRSGELAAATISAGLRGALSTSEAAQLYESAWRREFATRLQCADILGKVLMSSAAPALIKLLSGMPRATGALLNATRGAMT